MKSLEHALGRKLPRVQSSEVSQISSQAPVEVSGPVVDKLVNLLEADSKYVNPCIESDLDKYDRITKYVEDFVGSYFNHFQTHRAELLNDFAENHTAKYMEGLISISKAIATRPPQTLINIGGELSLANKLNELRNYKR
ncbi:MAG: hypothetical protein ACREBU_00215 [Nitrososphaera sp.]